MHFARHGATLIDAGYTITPIEPGKKRPSIKDWQNARIDRKQHNKMALNGQAEAGLGILTGVGDVAVTLCDIDSLDADLVSTFSNWITKTVGPTAIRVGKAPKAGLVYRVDAGLSKITSTVFIDDEGGKHQLEWLGKGQQFVAYGVHPDTGSEYEWPGIFGELVDCSMDEFPIVTEAQMREAVDRFEALCLERGWRKKSDLASSDKKTRLPKPEGLSRAQIEDMLRHVSPDCDYEDWFRIMAAIHLETGGSEEGLRIVDEWSEGGFSWVAGEVPKKWRSFKRAEGSEVVGIGTLRHFAMLGGWVPEDQREPAFDVAPISDSEQEAIQLPFIRNNSGFITAVAPNVNLATEHWKFSGMKIAFDRFQDMLMCDHGFGWEPFQDHHYFELQLRLERAGFLSLGKDLIKSAVKHTAQIRRKADELPGIDTAINWGNSIKGMHDGIERIATFYSKYMGCEDTPYSRALGLYTWTALAGRLMSPGIQADIVPIWMGKQGVGKSRGLRAMVPSPRFITNIHLGDKDDNINRMLRGKLIGEFDELKGLNSKDAESIKSFVTQSDNKWVPKYEEFEHTYHRRCLFIGTTNSDEFLSDSTGNRRFAPIVVGKIDVAGIERDRDLLWAEAIALFEAGGIQWTETSELAEEEHDHYMVSDTWEHPIADWLASSDGYKEPPRGEKPFSVTELLERGIGMSLAQQERRDQMRAANILRRLGYVSKNMRLAGKVGKYWVKG